MKVVVQKVLSSSVSVNDEVVGKIDKGLMVLVGFTEGDNISNIDYVVNKIVNLRIFEDNNGVMNLSLLDVGGAILSVSQFTLYGDCSKGNRPSYVKSLNKDSAKVLYELFNKRLRDKGVLVEEGIFHADMKVSLINDGPTTIIIEK